MRSLRYNTSGIRMTYSFDHGKSEVIRRMRNGLEYEIQGRVDDCEQAIACKVSMKDFEFVGQTLNYEPDIIALPHVEEIIGAMRDWNKVDIALVSILESFYE